MVSSSSIMQLLLAKIYFSSLALIKPCICEFRVWLNAYFPCIENESRITFSYHEDYIKDDITIKQLQSDIDIAYWKISAWKLADSYICLTIYIY